MSLTPSARSHVPPFHVMEVMKAAQARAEAGGDVLHLEVGEPATPAPAPVRRAADAALRGESLSYTAATGIGDLRERIAHHYLEGHGVRLAPERVVVTIGASGACILAFHACFDVGDRVAVPVPGYPCYRNMLSAFGVEVVPVRVGAESAYRLDPGHLEAAGRLDGVVVASPANPTGTMLDAGALRALATHCAERDIRLVVDEVYHGITYERPADTAVAVWDEAVVVNSFSKYFSMTGWRLGWLVVPDSLLAPVERLSQNLFISPPTLAQIGGIAAFDALDELEANVAVYARNRRILLDGLPRVGVRGLAPSDGTFFVWGDVGGLADDSQALCREWLEDAGVAATPGIDFDPEEGHGFVRFSFAGATADIEEAVRRLAAWRARGQT